MLNLLVKPEVGLKMNRHLLYILFKFYIVLEAVNIQANIYKSGSEISWWQRWNPWQYANPRFSARLRRQILRLPVETNFQNFETRSL